MSGCWKRVALIIGHALAGNPQVPSLGEFSETSGYPEFLVDALRPCEDVDKYLLRGNEIPQYIMHMISLGVIDKALVERYGEAINEIKRIFETEKNREKVIHIEYEGEKYYYLLGLAYIIADAVRVGKNVNNNDAAIALEAAAWALLGIRALTRALTFDNVESILLLLGALRDKAPGKYLILLYNALRILMPELIRHLYPSAIRTLDLIYESTNYIQEKYANELSGTDNITIAEIKASLARIAVEGPIGIYDLNKAINLLDEAALMVLGKLPLYLRLRMHALKLKILRAGSISEYVDVAKNLENLLSIAEKVISSWVKLPIEKPRIIAYVPPRGIDTYYEALSVLGDYLIYLALVGDYPRIKELLNHYITLSNALAYHDRYRSMIILSRAMLMTLLRSKPDWDTDAADKLLNYTKHELTELIKGLLNAYRNSADEYVPALKLLLGFHDREGVMKDCERFQGLKQSLCRTAILSVTGDEQATNYLKHYYMALIDKAIAPYPYTDMTFINDLDGKTLVQLLYQLRLVELDDEVNRLLMFISSLLYSLINGDVKTFMSYIHNEILLRYFLFRCLCFFDYYYRCLHCPHLHELLNKLLFIPSEPPSTILSEIYSSCCDMNNEKFKLALLKLYYAIDVALNYYWP